jgi:acyl dehydratase
VDLSTLEPGQSLFSSRLTLTSDAVAAYLAAVEDDSPLYAREHLVPPMAVAALVMGALMEAVELPAGAVHTGQELQFAAPVAEGAEVVCGATVVQNSVRRGTRFLVLEISGDVGTEAAFRGRVSLAVQESNAGEASEGKQ